MNNTSSSDINSTTTNTKKFELFNLVSETGDSIYSLTLEELKIAEERGDQVYVSEEWVRKIIQEELDKRMSGDLQRDE